MKGYIKPVSLCWSPHSTLQVDSPSGVLEIRQQRLDNLSQVCSHWYSLTHLPFNPSITWHKLISRAEKKEEFSMSYMTLISSRFYLLDLPSFWKRCLWQSKHWSMLCKDWIKPSVLMCYWTMCYYRSFLQTAVAGFHWGWRVEANWFTRKAH